MAKKSSQKKQFIIGKSSILNAPRKIGLDANVLVELVHNIHIFADRAKKIFNHKNLIFTHQICYRETIKVLVNKKGYSKSDAVKKLNAFIKKHNITIDKSTMIDDELLKAMQTICDEKKIDFHPPDSIILHHFINAEVNTVISTDNGFLDSAKAFELIAEKFPTIKSEINSHLRKMFSKKH